MDTEEQKSLEELFAHYVDRLHDGERLDPERILAENPIKGGEILEYLEDYIAAASSGRGGELLGTLGDYTLRRQIGRGGMGVVYEAWENSMDRRVALKVLPPGVAVDEKALQRFVREAKTAGQLSHPNVVSVYAMGVKEQTPYYAMEFVEGETLAQIVARMRTAASDAPTPFGTARGELAFHSNVAKAFADAADGLQHAHSRGVVHRDIKPSNLILERAGEGSGASAVRLRILDFGLARLEGQESLSASGDVVGTPLYMSPEQARRRKIPVDHRTDIYSLGATLYEVLTLRPPLQGKDHEDTLSQIVSRDPRPPRQLNPQVPRDLETIVLKCLRKDPGDRYGTAEALSQDLRRFVRGDPIEARPPGRWMRWARGTRRHWKTIAGTAMLLALLALLGILVLKQAHEETARQVAAYDARLLAVASQIQLDAMTVRAQGGKTSLLDPEGIFQLFHRGLVLRGQGESSLRALLPDLTGLAESLPWRPDAWFHRARVLELLGRPGEARDDLRRALACDPDFVPALVLLTRILSGAAGEATAGGPPALERLRIALEAAGAPEWGRAWAEAEGAVAAGEWKAAEESFGKLVSEAGPGYIGLEVEARLGRGYARLRSGDFFGAVEDLAHAKERWASLLAPYLLLAEAYGRNDRLDEMQRILEEAHARTPDPRAAAAWAAVLCRRLNQNDAGLDWARRALNVRAESIFLYAMGRREELRRLAQQLVSADPAGADGHLYLGIVELEEALDSGCTLEGERRLSAAWDELSRAAEIDPDACLVQGHLGRILLARGKLDEAKVRFREQTRRGAQFAQCWFHVGYQYLCEGLPAEAEEAYRGGMALGVGAADGLDALGWIAASDRARLAEAEELLRQAIEANPLNAWLYATLGRVLRERGNLLESAGQLLRPLEPGKRSPLTGWAMADTARRLARTFSDLDWSSAPTELEDRLRRLEDASRMTPAPEVSSVLAIWRLRSGRWGDPGRALEHAERAAAGSSFKDPQILGILARARVGAGLPLGAVLTLERGIQMRRADRKMQALLEECRQKALPRLASCASVDALFGRLGSEREALARVLSDALGAPEAQLSVRATFPDGARDEGSPPHEGDADARARGAIVDSYIQALLLELRGDLAGAAEGLRALTEVPDPPPEVFRRLAELQIASGRREEALATLERGLRTPAGARADLWRRWAAAALADPGLSPAEALGRLERIDGPSAGTRREDLAWLLRALAEGSPIRIDAGATEHPPECPGWSRDRFSIGGYAPKPSFREIAATECQAPYRTARFFAPEEIAPGYAIPLPPGSWRVTLHFAEIKGWRSGARRFGVDCEGKRMFEGLDPSAEGAARAMIVSRVVEVTDGVLDITFVAEKEEPMVCGMELERANP